MNEGPLSDVPPHSLSKLFPETGLPEALKTLWQLLLDKAGPGKIHPPHCAQPLWWGLNFKYLTVNFLL